MYTIKFSATGKTNREDLVSFKNSYHTMVEQIKQTFTSGPVKLLLGRLVDENVKYTDVIQYHLTKMYATMADVYYFVDEDVVRKTIRFDSPLGEFPVFPYKKKENFILIGGKNKEYSSFVKEIINTLLLHQGDDVKLFYKNKNNSTTKIWVTLKEVNKSNLKCVCYQKVTNSGPTIEQYGKEGINKNHRFISENGFLYKVEIYGDKAFQHFSFVDEGEIIQTI